MIPHLWGILKMEAGGSPEMLVTKCQTARCHSPEKCSLNFCRCDYLRSSVTVAVSSCQKQCVHSAVNNFLDWPHRGAVMHYSGYVEPRGVVSVLPSQQEAVLCSQRVQNKSALRRAVVCEWRKSRIAVRPMENVQSCQKLGKSARETF
jgi:hypothetical protein